MIKGHNYGLCKKCSVVHIHPKGMLGIKHSKKSREKMSIAHKGLKHSNETKRKINQAQKGRKITWKDKIAETRKKLISEGKINTSIFANKRDLHGKNNPFYGKRHNPQTIFNMKKKLSKMFSLEGNPNWRGGKSFEPYNAIFNEKFKKENLEILGGKCFKCGKTNKEEKETIGQNLSFHHKDFNKKNTFLDNLILLYCSCHAKITNKYYGGI